jgi:hypothetical protein
LEDVRLNAVIGLFQLLESFEMRIHVENKVSLVLILMAGASLVSMLATLNIDHIINHDLYSYGLQFSTKWAVPYWTLVAVVFSMGWFIIVTAMAVELHFLLVHRRNRLRELEALGVPPEQVQSLAPNAEGRPSDRSEGERVKTAAEGEARTTALAVETEDDLSEFRVLLEEISTMTNPPVAGQKADGEQTEEK